MAGPKVRFKGEASERSKERHIVAKIKIKKSGNRGFPAVRERDWPRGLHGLKRRYLRSEAGNRGAQSR